MFKLVQLGPHCKGTLPDMLKLVHIHHEICTVGEKVFGIVLECFLLINDLHNVDFYHLGKITSSLVNILKMVAELMEE